MSLIRLISPSMSAMLHFTAPLLAVLLFAGDVCAQIVLRPAGGWPGRPRYADGRLSLTATGGVSKYFGEFTDENVGPAAGLHLRYALTPVLELGLGGEATTIHYTRRHRRSMGGTYEFQFGEANMVDRATRLLTGEAWLRLNFFPGQYFNAWMQAGAGMVQFSPEDYSNGDAAWPGEPRIRVLSAPVGAGFDYHITRRLSLQLGAVAHLVMSGELDAFDSGQLVEQLQQSQGLPGNPVREKTANDTYLTLSLGLTWHLFADTDFDGDGLGNDAEEEAGTNPYDPDTDGDGLGDFEEVRIHLTNPLHWDSDGDVLNDYVEVTRYRTDPTRADSDGDGLSDREELLSYGTDPLQKDTENDGLIDAEEKRLGSDPKKVDTDGDGLYDGDEVVLYHTNPVLPDSDGEGISDKDEVLRYGTDPNAADSDRDGLTDYEEIRLFRTDPRLPDSDGDGISDYEEIRRYGTDPLTAGSGAASSTPGDR
ncbi:MAG: binary toxin-like calcium binding domain-containing protein [Bacteroidota bacterium]|nr:binary toxin-like calcium binding domain-containing protein [Bacteroidota bacterium]